MRGTADVQVDNALLLLNNSHLTLTQCVDVTLKCDTTTEAMLEVYRARTEAILEVHRSNKELYLYDYNQCAYGRIIHVDTSVNGKLTLSWMSMVILRVSQQHLVLVK